MSTELTINVVNNTPHSYVIPYSIRGNPSVVLSPMAFTGSKAQLTLTIGEGAFGFLNPAPSDIFGVYICGVNIPYSYDTTAQLVTGTLKDCLFNTQPTATACENCTTPYLYYIVTQDPLSSNTYTLTINLNP